MENKAMNQENALIAENGTIKFHGNECKPNDIM
jgi:hypothetical protein